MHTHFAPIPADIPSMGVRFTLFSLGTCDQCDSEVANPNTEGCFESEAMLLARGLKKRDIVPGEMSYCAQVEMAVCEICEQKATADSDTITTQQLQNVFSEDERDYLLKDLQLFDHEMRNKDPARRSGHVKIRAETVRKLLQMAGLEIPSYEDPQFLLDLEFKAARAQYILGQNEDFDRNASKWDGVSEEARKS